jgi:hypothetical protein
VLKLGRFGEIGNIWKVLKCGAGEGSSQTANLFNTQTTSRALPTCDISPDSLTLPAPEGRRFMEIILVHMWTVPSATDNKLNSFPPPRSSLKSFMHWVSAAHSLRWLQSRLEMDGYANTKPHYLQDGLSSLMNLTSSGKECLIGRNTQTESCLT